MVAIVSGNGLGLFNSSLNQLGKRGVQGNASFGQARIEDYINIAEGNLVIRQQGYNLAATGQDIQSVLTYNSKGLLNNNAQWSGEWSRRLSLVGNLNEAGSKIIVTAEDGHEVTFNFSSANNYISKEGDGAYDKLTISGTTWTVTDGKTLARESYTYDAAKKTGRLTGIQDNNGTNLVYSYDSTDRLISIKDNSSLNELIYQYDGTSNRIKRIDTKVGGGVSQNVYYEYDTANRLSKVITDLTPSDNQISDQQVYTTTYAYDGSSSRIASITQSDGSSVQFSYELDTVKNVYRVKTVKDSQGTTTFSYAANKTTVTNSLQEVWEYSYDASQQLTSIKNANAEVSSFTYDADGNVLTITDNESNKLTYRYDSNGNLTEEYGPTGKAIKYSYTNNTQLATVTEYLTLAIKDASGNWVLPTTGETKSTQYLYDAQRLRFVISAEGAVLEYIYNDKGQLVSKGGNYQAKYASTMTYAAVDTWAKKQLKKELSSYEYDVYGNLKKEIHYSSIDATADATTGGIKNQGVMDDAAELIDYVYDARGLLLQKITRRGADRATAGGTAASSVQSFAYDGMGRVLSEVGSTGTTSYSYGKSKITVTNAAGLSTVQSFDSYGRLTSTVQTATNLSDRTTSYLYDEVGRLIYSKQPSGYEQFNFYDKKGRLTGVVDSSGLLTEYVYNKNDLQTKEIRYATAVSSAGWLANGVVSKKRVEEIRPAVAGLDRVIEKSYDSSSRLISVKQANGLITEYSYDSYGNIIQTKAGDRISRYFYNKDNLQVAALDAEGYLVETVYNSAGQKVQVNRHSKVTTENLRATGTLAQLKPTGTDNTILSSFYFYDAQGQLIGTVDEKKFVTAYLYNQKTNSVTTRQYALATTATVSSTSAWADIIKLPADNTYQDTTKSYDLQGRLIKVVDPRQGTTSYVYDEAGRLIKETLAASTTNERVAYTRYNAFGEVTHMLRGEAANQLTSGMTADQVEQVYNEYAIKTFYDAVGRKTQVMSAAEQLTTFYYDKAGRLTHQINAEGNVVETGYSLFGEVISSTQYSKSLAATATDLATGTTAPSALAKAVGVGKNLKGGELTTTFSSLVTAIKDATRDRIEKLEYDKLGKVSKKTDGLSNSITSVYNLYGELEQQTQQVTLGTTKTTLQSSYAYSKRGELKSTILDSTGLKNTTLKQYDAYGRVITETDANGNVTRFDYSQDQGRTIQVTSADQGVTKTTYDAWGRQLIVNRNNNLTSYTYNDQAKTLTVKSPEGLQTITQYNEFGDVVQVTQANQGKSTYLYNDDGQKTKETNAVGATTNYVYDKKTGLLSESTDAVGVKTSYYYDNANRVISQIVTLSATESQETSYSYDGLGERLEVIEAKGSANERVTQYGYDKAGNLISVTQDAKGLKLVTSYSYDETGRQVKVTDKGLTTVYTYDALGRRISEVKDPGGLALKVEYRYDANGNVTRKIDEAGNSSWYVYNTMNQLVYTVNSLGGVSGSVYDLNGKVIAQYQYTALQDVSGWASKDIVTAANVTVSKTTANLIRFVYNKDGLEIYRIDAEGAVTETQYNELGKVAHVLQYDKVVTLAGEALTADSIKTALTTAKASAQTQSYYYDALGRVIYSMNAAGYVTRNDYDALNRIIRVLDFRIATTLARNSTLAQMDGVYKASALPAYVIHYMYYDKLGRKVYDLNQHGILTRYRYDELGNLTAKKETVLHYTAVLDLLRTKDAAGNLSARPPASIENYDAGLALLTEAQYRETNYYYDKVGRIAYQIDALGYVTRYNTNAAGQITNPVKYTAALAAPLSRSSTLAALNTVYLSSTPPAYTVTGTLYDAVGRKVVETNEMNLVTHYSYDALGNVVSKKVTTVTLGDLLDLLRTKDANGVYTSARPATTLANSNAAMLLLPATKMQETKYFYDKAGRRSHDIDALGYVTAYSYNAQGQQTSVKQTALNSDGILDLLRTKDTAGNFTVPRPALTADNLDKGIKLLAATNYRETSSYYDKDGRLSYQIDAQGYVTRYSYDAFDNVTSTARFNAATSLSRSSTLAQLDTSYKTATTLPEHALTQYAYDALNRKVKETDAEGYSIETGYDAFNNVIWVKDKLGNKGYFAYDGLNRNTVKIDPEGYVTIYTYDVFGNQLTERKYLSPANQIDKAYDANGLYTGIKTLASSTEVAPTTQPYWNVGVVYVDVTYQYDKLNRKTVIKDASGAYEAYTYTDGSAQPATYRNKLGGVYSYSYDKLGRLIKETLPELSGGKAVTHLYEYDAFGNKTKQVEASGLAEQRVSVYQYDNLNRLTAKIAEAVSTVQLQVKDARKPYLKGKVETTSAVAQESYQYDGYGNQILKTEANGAKTFSYYDKNARKIAEVNPLGGLTRWEYNAAGLVTKLQSYETPVSLPTQAGGAVPATPAGNVRVIEYGYDKVGRQTSVISPNIASYEYDSQGKGALITQSAIEKTYYDGNGNIIRVEDAKGNSSYTYYDKAGRKVLAVDQEGYATSWSYGNDATSQLNILTEVKYAKKLNRAVTGTDTFTSLTSLLVKDAENDRTTVSSYDKLGRVIKTELLNVSYSDGSVLKKASSVTYFTYNALDKVLTKTENAGETLNITYDKLGRESIRTFGSYTDSKSATVKQRISSVYNGLGLLSSSAVLGTNDTVSTDDRVTQYSYDKLGRLIKETDVSLGHSVNYGYDLMGNRTWTSNSRKANDGITKYDETLIEYNLMGKEITRQTNEGVIPTGASVISWKTLEERETRYNVFGEITGKRLVKTDSTTKSTDSWQEVTEYNNQGKVWKSNANNGVTRYYLYDRNGNATLQLDTTGTGITAKSADQLKDLTGVSYTETVYDKRNQVIEVREPKFNQDKLDISLNLFNQTISRTVDKSTVSLTDSANKLSFNAETQKLSIQANAEAKRVMIKYWPKGSTATASNTLTVDMQATTTAGLFVLDIGAIKANIDYSYSYSSDVAGKVLDSGTGVIKRSVNVVDVFSGGTVTAKTSVDINDIDYKFKGKAELINHEYILIKDLPKETSRVEVKYRVYNLSNWGTLSYAAPFDSSYGGYLVNLNTLDTNTNFDYLYILYDSSGHILGGNKGSVNQNYLYQQDVFYDYYKDVIYGDKDKIVNEKNDVNKSVWSLGSSVDSTILSSYPLKIKYTFNQNGIRNYGDYVFSLFFKGKNGSFEKVTPNSYASRGEGNLDVIVEFTKDELDRIYNITETSNQGSKGFLDIKIGLFQDKKYIEIGSGIQNISVNNNYWGPSYSLDGTSKISLKEKSAIRLTNQPINTTSSILYYRRVDSYNVPEDKYSGWIAVQAEPLYDIYGERVNGVFDVNLPYIENGQKYEFQYISFNKMEVINRQNGILEPYGLWDGSLMILMSNIPLNYGGSGFVIPHQGDRINSGFAFFIPTISTGAWGPDYPTSEAIFQYRKVGTQEWVDSDAWGTWETGYLLWYTAGLADGDYEFKLKTYNTFEFGGESFVDNDLTTKTQLIGKIRKDFVLDVLEQWPSSLFENKITFASQPTGSSKVTVKYGTAAGLLNKTVVLPVDSEGKAILDATDLAEQNLFGSTTVYYSYETTDANGKLLNRATGYVNVGMGAGSGQHTNQLNDSWLDFQPAQNNGSKMELFYRKRQVDASGNFVSDLVSADINSDAYWASSNQFQKVSITPSNGIYRWNLNDLVPTSGFENYEYFYQLYDSAGKVIAFVPGKLSIDSKGNGSSQQNKWVINGSGDRASQIVKSQAYNAFGEIISETDGNGNTSSLSYNTMGKLTKKVLPTVDIRKSDGTVVQGTPTLEYGYDLSGRLLTSKDANGNINKQSYLNGRNLETGDWLVEKETHADTGEVSNLYDVYGNLIEQSNALGVKTGYSYDINGNLIQITRAARTTGTVGANHITSGGVQTSLIDTFTYDELGNRLTATNALKNTTTTDYDALGRVVQSKTAEGVTTKVDYVYDASISNLNSSKGGIRRTETDGLGKTLVDEQDYFGRTIKHTDKGEHVFNYTYNAGGWLTKQTNSQGQSIDYSYYSNGSVKEIRDIALNLLTSYRYDNNGNRIEERYQELVGRGSGEILLFQNALINYDSLNRKISVQDQSFNIHYEYDGNGNIVHMLANYRDTVNAAPKIQDFWYSYDSMNRFTISMGVLNSTTKKVERGNTGIAISYDKLGQRLTADYGKDALNSTKAHKESYSYTTDGYLETVKNADYSSTGILGTQYTVSTRYNDALGRVTKYTDNNENSDTVYQTTTTTYSKNNQITEQKKEGGNGAGTTQYTYLADKVTLDKTVMTPTSGSIQTTQYAYEWWDSAKQNKITTTVDGLNGETTLTYDVNGHSNGFIDAKNAQNRRAATYINNSQGMVLQRSEIINDSLIRYRNFYYVNGQRVGDLSNDGPSREDYVQNLQNNRATATQAKDFKPISSADFDQNFEPINAQYPSSASTSYVVNNGDTLQSIALSVWGDASMWYMLADVNGLSATDKLTAGQVLTVPNKVTNIHNNSETFRPYNPGEAIGNTQPTVPSPPPPPKPKKKCGGIAQIVMIVVAIVVTIYTAGAAAGLMAGLGRSAFGVSAAFSAGLTAMSTSAVAAGIGAAVGSAASQLAGKAMGGVDSFSWKQVGISALTAAATAGVGGALSSAGGTVGTTGATATQSSWLSAAKMAINNGGWVAKGAVYGAVSYGSTYLANQVFGNNQSFSWASLGSSIVGSIAAAGIGAKGLLDGLGTTVSPYAYSLAGANAAAVIDDKWFGGSKPDYLNVSMAAIANAGVRQFGESSSSSQYKSNITVYNPATGERTALENTPSLYAYSGGEFIDDLRNFNWSGIRDGIKEEFFDYKPNNSRESSIALVNGANSDVTQLPTIKVKATDSIVYALGGVNSTYNMTAALGRVEERARLQREIDISNANNRRTWQEWANDANYSGSFIDAAKYVSRQTYLKVANFTTFGLYSRSDERLLQVRQGKLSPSLARRADLIEAGTGAVVTLATGGAFNFLRTTGSAGLATMGAGRTVQYYGGSAIAGAGSGALMDTGIQSAERINYDISGGITGRSEYDLGQITLSSVVGGVASPLLGAIPAFANSKYNVDLQWPIDFDVSAGQLNSGIPLRVRTPIKSLDIDNISIPSVRNGEFANWFNNISSDEFQQIWSVGKFQNQIKTRLRSPGGLHEWHLVSRADVFKNWGVKAEQIAELRTAISDVKFVNPKGIHGGKGSTIAHNELLDIIDTSLNYDTFVRRLQNWSNYRLDGGVSSLPQGLQPK
ncbi:lysM domain protein [Acinetobacter baumannii 541915]|uniref:LysM peptidoglycan-binding domain-containing protein n=1 Tax=Acinetobacter baumannii TaxID=470 RepID=UPI0004514863|nr:LysM peptidoglycan-binding domain-containing protein [Acinetobacter baumannii]EXR78371.1 lysM domain protein [Acinetobacter baumannii 541915]